MTRARFLLMATLILLGLLAFCFNNIVLFVVGVGLLVSALLLDKGFPEVARGERQQPGEPPFSHSAARHVRILTIARPSSVLFDQDQP